MSSHRTTGPTRLSWVLVAALFALCGVLGILQYRWIDEVSAADRDRLRNGLQVSLLRLSREFNSEITDTCTALLPQSPVIADESGESEYAARYREWKRSTRHGQVFLHVALAVPRDGKIALRMLDLNSGTFQDGEWPATWSMIRERMEARLSAEPGAWRSPPAQPVNEDRLIFELPRFTMPPEPPARERDRERGPFRRRELEWLVVEMNVPYLRDAVLPELVQRYLGAGGTLDYQVEVVARRSPSTVIYRSDSAQQIARSADASVNLCDLQMERIFRRFAPAGANGRGPGGPGLGPGPGPSPDAGRWQMFVRHRTGSLETVVAHARLRNLAVTGGVLLLMLASVAALIRYTRRAQKLAAIEMEFVAGVSHELRTPLTVIHTAAYNLRGKVAANPAQVERYGALIQQESGRLAGLVEQVLRFANAKAGRIIGEPRPVDIDHVIEDSINSSMPAIRETHSVLERNIDPNLPQVLGDAVALKHVLQNLLSNAAKYGTEGSNWIGVSASASGDKENAMVEVRVADRGPGIPEDEQQHIFDPFFRGRRAVRDQIHGTGLGLNLARQIVEAHQGSIAVKSEPMKGTEFVVRIPAIPVEQQDEFSPSVN